MSRASQSPHGAWRRSTYSGGNNECVEVATPVRNHIPVRDSKQPEGPVVVFGTGAWGAFVASLR
ncbi:DUF397 domain-containing protein [Streptomyces johnsoniae]|uniref:DUF397 domain-containing protein n=1 Tax=Streptomyces johnsoniae TaxID=3075532 RepID=A0ABU2S7I3_9ACTN|nr:DUF397 domain-containing protein [Streptomyces sp. DSM 41886]MDT0444877.1 DUF397 domain-containing protein [Streptomyces sp. DSM 41886]